MSSSPSPSPLDMSKLPRKRRRAEVPEDEKLEIDIEAPEPASKRAKRLERKKQKRTSQRLDSTTTTTTTTTTTAAAAAAAATACPTATAPNRPVRPNSNDSSPASPTTDAASKTAKRSPHGIWIGNLPFTATKETLFTFLANHASIPRHGITRLHLPRPTSTSAGPRPAQNKGFAYIDFASPDYLAAALACSETLCAGRRVLIKDAENFSGRPTPMTGAATAKAAAPAVAPSRKVFVGNLPFHTTGDDLRAHFAPAGEVVDVHVATFEDSGKCRGYGWVRFAEVEGAEGAVRGFVYVDQRANEGKGEADEGDGDEEKVVGAKKRKWFLNRMQGRELRCEFAEDAQTRYQKRFGRGSGGARDPGATATTTTMTTVDEPDRGQAESEDRREGDDGDGKGGKGRNGKALQNKKTRHKHLDAEARRAERRRVHDARTIAPGRALANAPRRSAAIAAGEGTKIVFD